MLARVDNAEVTQDDPAYPVAMTRGRCRHTRRVGRHGLDPAGDSGRDLAVPVLLRRTSAR